MASPLTDAARGVLEHLDYLVEAWPDLVTIGVEPSRRRRVLPSSRRARSAESVEMASAQARAELAERREPGWVQGPGRHAVPIDVEMLDLLALVVSAAEDLGSTITQTAGVDRPPHAESAWADPRPWLLVARAWLTAADAADARTVPWAAGVLGPVVRRVAAAVGEIVDGQVLDALCPWCGGRWQGRSGARTLVVHSPGSATTGARAESTAPGLAGEGPMIVCQGTSCTPPDSAVGKRVRGMPAWPEREWDWLAKQLRPVDGADTPKSGGGVA